MLAGPGAHSTLLVAVSGGGDSLALLHGLATLRPRLALQLVVAHLDHSLRPESAADAAFVGRVAQQLGLLCLRERRPVAALAEAAGQNLENQARQERYAMLEEAAQAVGADAIALAHTADDQAETLLMHLLRGAGLDGLKGMTPLSPSPLPHATAPLFRPLLRVERATLRRWLEAQGLAWREDPTNALPNRLRNRIRHQLLPLLEEERPGVHRRLAQSAHLLATDHAFLEQASEQAWSQVATREGQTIRLARAPFLAQPVTLQRRLLRRAFFTLHPQARDLSFEQVEVARHLAAEGAQGSRATLPRHLFLFVEDAALWIGREIGQGSQPLLTERLPLPLPGEVEGGGLRVTVTEVGREVIPARWEALPLTTTLLDRARVQAPLTLRPPQAGDRWAPLGMGGQQVDLQGWMAKKKVPAGWRERLPLLVDGSERILWVVGWQGGEQARIRPESQQLLQIAVQKSVVP